MCHFIWIFTYFCSFGSVSFEICFEQSDFHSIIISSIRETYLIDLKQVHKFICKDLTAQAWTEKLRLVHLDSLRKQSVTRDVSQWTFSIRFFFCLFIINNINIWWCGRGRCVSIKDIFHLATYTDRRTCTSRASFTGDTLSTLVVVFVAFARCVYAFIEKFASFIFLPRLPFFLRFHSWKDIFFK